MTESDHITAKATGSKRLQFIATVRKAIRSVHQGRAPVAAMADIERALAVLDKEKKG